ncbi:hypothetical protein [Tsukamurella columbiensis]|uniref:DUF4129 domain-containing protein n=1 Tax=Tsukamurella columbiensis TaxID=128509 RepID=A0ABX1LFU8_9ACTN|nr:hypothetical protein [Tsukamurella columbiensis]NMD57136.1 hypothetical protein [Tsukamurella columbiensis]
MEWINAHPLASLLFWWAIAFTVLYIGRHLVAWLLVQLLIRIMPSRERKINKHYSVLDRRPRELVPDASMPYSTIKRQRVPSGLTKAQFKEWEHIADLAVPIDHMDLVSWAQWDMRRSRLVGLIVRTRERLGGASGLVITLAVAWWLRPIPGVVSWINDAWTRIGSFVSEGQLPRYLPAVLLVLGLIIAIGRMPLIDRVRAPVDAAKDTNAHLARFMGGLYRTAYGHKAWFGVLSRRRDEILSNALRTTTTGRYVWQIGRVIPSEKALNFGLPISEMSYEAKAKTEIVEAVDELREILNAISVAGLSGVATRALYPVIGSARKLGLDDFALRDERTYAAGRFWVPSTIDEGVAESMKLLKFELQDEDRQRAEWAVEQKALDVAKYLDHCLAEVIMVQLHCVRVAHHINKRTAGTTLTKALGGLKLS